MGSDGIFKSEYSSKGMKQIKRSTESIFAASILKPPTDYVLKFGIEPKGTVSGWNSIIHFTNNKNCCAYGARVPGIWFHSGTTRLHVSTGTTTNGNHYQDLSEQLAINKKSIVEVRVVGSLAKVFIGDPWYPAANAIISDISFTSPHDF